MVSPLRCCNQCVSAVLWTVSVSTQIWCPNLLPCLSHLRLLRQTWKVISIALLWSPAYVFTHMYPHEFQTPVGLSDMHFDMYFWELSVFLWCEHVLFRFLDLCFRLLSLFLWLTYNPSNCTILPSLVPLCLIKMKFVSFFQHRLSLFLPFQTLTYWQNLLPEFWKATSWALIFQTTESLNPSLHYACPICVFRRQKKKYITWLYKT